MVAQKLEMPNNMREETERDWVQVSDGRAHFAQARQVADELRAVTKPDMLAWFDK